MYKVLISLSMILFAFTANAQYDEFNFNYATDFDSMLSQAKDPESNFFYAKLVERFQHNDSILTDKEVLTLMIGFTANENYKPFQNVEREREILDLMTDEKYKEALAKSSKFLETNPLSLAAIIGKGNSLWKLKRDEEESEAYRSQYFNILHAIALYSGDGSENYPYFILSPIDGQTLIKYGDEGRILTKDSGRDENGNFLDIFEVEKNERIKKLYFNIQHAMDKSGFSENPEKLKGKN